MNRPRFTEEVDSEGSRMWTQILPAEKPQSNLARYENQVAWCLPLQARLGSSFLVQDNLRAVVVKEPSGEWRIS